MKHFLLSLIILISGCRHREQDVKVSNLQKLQEKRDFYCSQDIDLYDKKLDLGCDFLTFGGLYDAYCKQFNIFKHEYSYTPKENAELPFTDKDQLTFVYKTGQWNRQLYPCYVFDNTEDGETDSRSGISFEAQLGAMHACWARQDVDCFRRMYKYAIAHDWILGEGSPEYTHLNELSYLMEKAIEKLGGSVPRLAMYEEEDSKTIFDKLKGYRGKVIADYISLKGQVYGYLNTYENRLLALCLDKDPENPIYNILWGKYHEDSQEYIDKGVSVLLDESIFPSDQLPGHLEQIDWGDNLGQAIYAWILSDLE